jgi:hypothetical protein
VKIPEFQDGVGLNRTLRWDAQKDSRIMRRDVENM